MCVSWLSLYTFAEVQLQKSLVRRCRRCDEEEIEKLKCPISPSFSFHHSFAINLKEFKESNTFLCMLAIFSSSVVFLLFAHCILCSTNRALWRRIQFGRRKIFSAFSSLYDFCCCYLLFFFFFFLPPNDHFHV